MFTEKPLCIHREELEEIRKVFSSSDCRLMVGFNRRFAPMSVQLKQKLNTNAPLAILMRVNAGVVAKDHWIHDPKVGGGRIKGEVCHFIDYAAFLADSTIAEVSATAMSDSSGLEDTLSITLKMENGSIATIAYFSNGNKEVSKEYIEVYNGGLIAKIDDFKELTISDSKGSKKSNGNQDKGHKLELEAFVQSIKTGNASPISFESLYNSTLATFAVVESISQNGKNISLNSL